MKFSFQRGEYRKREEFPQGKLDFSHQQDRKEEKKSKHEKEAHRGMKNNHNSCNIRYPIAKRKEEAKIIFAILLLVVRQRVSEL